MAELQRAEESSGSMSFTAVLLSTFTTVFLAELGDKTQLATLLLSAQSGQPWLVFLGAAMALICSSLVGVLVGRWLSQVLPPERLEQMAGLLMVGLGLWLGVQALQSMLQNANN
ncbi:TMEM165/GDT1 family protein [Synechococcus sp. HK01-R]|uniref:TMEM165/GDT1 family protein n=1 Tax=Synechococcus sp. HK01-R TaxID=2751171 RepID=UPI002107748C|nr:TMEM165/GDT1 family protein [Synechococcus sp. HK01-R]